MILFAETHSNPRLSTHYMATTTACWYSQTRQYDRSSCLGRNGHFGLCLYDLQHGGFVDRQRAPSGISANRRCAFAHRQLPDYGHRIGSTPLGEIPKAMMDWDSRPARSCGKGNSCLDVSGILQKTKHLDLFFCKWPCAIRR